MRRDVWSKGARRWGAALALGAALLGPGCSGPGGSSAAEESSAAAAPVELPPREFAPGDRPLRHPGAQFVRVGDEYVLQVPGRPEVGLSPEGRTIFTMLDGEHTAEEIAEALVEEFGMDRERALRGILEFLREMDREGMLARDAGS